MVLISYVMALSPAQAEETNRRESRRLRVLIVTPEQNGVIQTGGLADAVSGLAHSLNEAGVETDILMPWYFEMEHPKESGREIMRIPLELNFTDGKYEPKKFTRFMLVESRTTAARTLFLRHEPQSHEPNYFDNRQAPGKTRKIYSPVEYEGESFGAFNKAAAQVAIEGGYDLVILNDWTTGLVALHLHEAKSFNPKTPKVLFAIHNLAYQGKFPRSLSDFLGIHPRHFHMDGIEWWGDMNMLKAGIAYSDMIYTVSPKYAEEIATQTYGMGFDGLIRKKISESRVTGILNGIRYSDWDPSRTREGLPFNFSINNMGGKEHGKAWLQEQFGLEARSDIPLIVLTSRLAEQKGVAYALDAFDLVASQENVQIIIIGDGNEEYVERAQALSEKHPTKIRAVRFRKDLEQMAIAYGDFLANFAWFEPSGLNQFYAMASGTIPLVSRVGGLSNSVRENETGFLADIVMQAAPEPSQPPYNTVLTRNSVIQTLKKAISTFHDHPAKIRAMRIAGMREKTDWKDRVREHFLPLLHFTLESGPERLQAIRNQTKDKASLSRVPSPQELYSQIAPPEARPFTNSVVWVTRPRTCRVLFNPKKP